MSLFRRLRLSAPSAYPIRTSPPVSKLHQELGDELYRKLSFAWNTRNLDRHYFLPLSVPEDIEEPYRPSVEGFGDAPLSQ